MKGVIIAMNPSVRIIDISHLVTHGNITEGAFILDGAYGYFPAGTIHLAVVDPGVGGTRRPILVETDRHIFVGPDNGIFSLIAARERLVRVVHLIEEKYFLPVVSRTFHGRDIYAPVTARLSLGALPALFGPQIDTQGLAAIESPPLERTKNSISGSVVYIDSFGNLITNITKDVLAGYPGRVFRVRIKTAKISGLMESYVGARAGLPIALIGSAGHLEIAVNRGMASKLLNAKTGDKVLVDIMR